MSEDPIPTYQVVVWHGEGRSVWYVLAGFEGDESWDVVETCRNRREARELCERLNRAAARDLLEVVK